MGKVGKISVELCSDHFERLRNDDVCNTCPSNVLNEKKVLALSEMLRGNKGNSMIASELMSIREHQKEYGLKIEGLDRAIRGDGNGEPGLASKINSMRTAINVLRWGFSVVLSITLALLAIYFSR